MGLLITLLVAGIAGYLASVILKTEHRMGMLLDIAAGLIGSFLVRFLLGLPAGDASVVGLVWSTLGAVVVIAAVKALRNE